MCTCLSRPVKITVDNLHESDTALAPNVPLAWLRWESI